MLKIGVLIVLLSMLVIASANENSNYDDSNSLVNLKEQKEDVKNDLQNQAYSLVKSLAKAMRHKKLRDELENLIKLYDELKKKHKKNNLMRF